MTEPVHFLPASNEAHAPDASERVFSRPGLDFLRTAYYTVRLEEEEREAFADVCCQ